MFSTDGTDWTQGRYDVAGRSAIQGMATGLTSCAEDGASTLEFRLAEHFTKLRMTIGQGNTSAKSTDVLVVQVIANGSQIDSRNIKFSVEQPFSEDITGVNALQIVFSMDQDKCANDGSDGLQVVLQGMTVS